jgi:pilus assembly protein CpaF
MTKFGQKQDIGYITGQANRVLASEGKSSFEHQSFISNLENIEKMRTHILGQLNIDTAIKLERSKLSSEVYRLLRKIAQEYKIHLNDEEEQYFTNLLVDDMVGLGPLEPLLEDDTITDILINGPQDVVIERNGVLEVSTIQFRDMQHLMNIAQRIAHRIGRRIDESAPMLDARLENDTRVNIIIPPLCLSGISMSIRKFRKAGLTLDQLIEFGSITPEIKKLIKLALRCHLNILVSGGTGAGKTTLLNAASIFIDPVERVITIEDTAELRLKQPHVVRLESRPPNLEGKGEITIRDLVKNALRMRPDRIIVGEVRGAEVIDMLQALNTGHQGSMSTIHANKPKDAMTRLENMAYLGGLKVESHVLKALIAGAIDLIIHIERFRDGTRRIVSISEIELEGRDHILTSDIVRFEHITEQGKTKGRYVVESHGGKFKQKAIQQGFQSEFEDALSRLQKF